VFRTSPGSEQSLLSCAGTRVDLGFLHLSQHSAPNRILHSSSLPAPPAFLCSSHGISLLWVECVPQSSCGAERWCLWEVRKAGRLCLMNGLMLLSRSRFATKSSLSLAFSLSLPPPFLSFLHHITFFRSVNQNRSFSCG
jgi:hypothetical protein